MFVDRLLTTRVHLRHGVTRDGLACWFGGDHSTLTRAIGEIQPLLAERGCTVSPGVRLRTLAEVIDHLGVVQGQGRRVRGAPVDPFRMAKDPQERQGTCTLRALRVPFPGFPTRNPWGKPLGDNQPRAYGSRPSSQPVTSRDCCMAGP
ncbi:transposase family protein [Streptomyces anulatus]|uniref:helix-turn-helix domain-containing protein n=1 Tax=Streptomyces anulatus TaxID=1892 RepID=UPI0036A5F50D